MTRPHRDPFSGERVPSRRELIAASKTRRQNHSSPEVVVGIFIGGVGCARHGCGWFHLRKPRTEATCEIYDLNVGIGEVGRVSLRVNPSTGCSWSVEPAPSSSVVDVSVSEDVDPTIDCGNPPRLGCSNKIAVYSFKSVVPGDYEIELRYGHAWTHGEYYAVAIIHLTVTGLYTMKRR